MDNEYNFEQSWQGFKYFNSDDLKDFFLILLLYHALRYSRCVQVSDGFRVSLANSADKRQKIRYKMVERLGRLTENISMEENI